MDDEICRMVLSVPEACRALGISRSLGYDCVKKGTIPSLRVGRRRLIPKAAIERLLNEASNPDGSGDEVAGDSSERHLRTHLPKAEKRRGAAAARY